MHVSALARVCGHPRRILALGLYEVAIRAVNMVQVLVLYTHRLFIMVLFSLWIRLRIAVPLYLTGCL